MKTLYLSIITILVLVISITSNVYAQSSSTGSASLAKVSVGLFNMTETSPTIVISGIVYKAFSQNIVLTIFNSQNQLISVSQLQLGLDRTFSQNIIPSNPLWSKGNYTVRMTSGSQNLTESVFYFPGIDCCKRIIIPGVQGHLNNSTNYLSPLQQFKSGIAAKDVKCKESFVLIIHTNGSPTCVKPTSVSRLLSHGWFTLEKFEIIHKIVQQNVTNSLDQNQNTTDQSTINYTQSNVISNLTYTNPIDITHVINNLDSLSGKRITVYGYWYDVYPFPHPLPACRAIDPNVKPIYDNTYAPNVFGGDNYLTNVTNWKGGDVLDVRLPNNAYLESPVIDRGKFVTVTGVLEKYYQINCWGDRYYKSAYLQVNPNQNNTSHSIEK